MCSTPNQALKSKTDLRFTESNLWGEKKKKKKSEKSYVSVKWGKFNP